jgi:hypothetical protein
MHQTGFTTLYGILTLLFCDWGRRLSPPFYFPSDTIIRRLFDLSGLELSTEVKKPPNDCILRISTSFLIFHKLLRFSCTVKTIFGEGN